MIQSAVYQVFKFLILLKNVWYFSNKMILFTTSKFNSCWAIILERACATLTDNLFRW